MRKIVFLISALLFIVTSASAQDADGVTANPLVLESTDQDLSLTPASHVVDTSDIYVYTELILVYRKGNLYVRLDFGGGLAYVRVNYAGSTYSNEYIAAMNCMAQRGWELDAVYEKVSTFSEKVSSDTHYVLKKRFKNLTDDEREFYNRSFPDSGL